MLLNGLSIAVYALISLYILKRDKRFTVFFAFIAFSQMWALVSCFYNDLGIYNIELFRYTEPSYATFRLGMLYLVFNLGFLLVMAAVKDRPLTRVDYRWSRETLDSGGVKLAIYTAIGLLIVDIVHSFYAGGIPALSGFNRLMYIREASKLEQILTLYSYLIAFALGYFRIKRGRFSVNGVLVFVFIIYSIFIGNKFSAIITILVYYYAPIFARYVSAHPGVKILTKRTVIVSVCTVLILLGIAFGSYLWVFGDSALAATYFKNRTLAFQGEMWWAADYGYYHDDLYDPGHLKTEFDAIVSPDDVAPTDVGMKYLMIRVLGPEKAYPIIEKGFLYTMTYPAILLTMIPLWVTFIIQFFAGVVFAVILYYLYYSVVYGHFVRSIIAVTILLPYTVVLVTGNLFVFFSFGMLIKIAVLLILEIVGVYRLRGAHGSQ
jgi:hypothetical protein